MEREKVICLLAIGEQYRKRLNEKMFRTYADKVNADLVVIDQPLDLSFKRDLLSQKLLVPKLVANYEIGCLLDIDIIINENCPSIFEHFDVSFGFSAVIDPRGSEEYLSLWGNHGLETTKEYFENRNFFSPDNDLLIGSINAGVLVFDPKKVKDLFTDYYYSNHVQKPKFSYEEAPMAFLTQVNGLFHPLDPKFNCQVSYKLRSLPAGKVIMRNNRKFKNRIIRKFFSIFTHNHTVPNLQYKLFIKHLLQHNHIVHFSGKYPIPFKS